MDEGVSLTSQPEGRKSVGKRKGAIDPRLMGCGHTFRSAFFYVDRGVWACGHCPYEQPVREARPAWAKRRRRPRV